MTEKNWVWNGRRGPDFWTLAEQRAARLGTNEVKPGTWSIKVHMGLWLVATHELDEFSQPCHQIYMVDATSMADAKDMVLAAFADKHPDLVNEDGRVRNIEVVFARTIGSEQDTDMLKRKMNYKTLGLFGR